MMRCPLNLNLLVAVSYLLVCASAALSAPVRIELLPSVTVQRELAKTSDVAKVTGGDNATRRIVEDLDVTERHASGRRLITKSQLALRLQLAGLSSDQYQIAGADVALVRWATRRATSTDDSLALPSNPRSIDSAITEMATHAFASRWQESPEDVEVRLARPLASNVRSLLENDPKVRIQPFLPQNVAPGAVRLPIGVYRGNSLVSRSVAILDVALYRQVAVAKRDISPRESISQDTVEFVRRSTQGRIANTAVVDVIGKVATHTVKKGAILTSSDIRSPRTGPSNRAAVKRGDIVRLVAKGKGLTVSMRNCEALEHGQEGEMIRLRNLSSRKTIAGRVVGVGEVEIAL